MNIKCRFFLTLFSVVALTYLTSCAVAVPTSVKPQIIRSDADSAEIDTNIRLTLASRNLLDDVKKYINEIHENIYVVDGFIFRDTAFGDSDNTLGNILNPTTCDRITNELRVDYLVILNPLVVRTSGDEGGFFVPMLAGAMSQEHESSITSMIIDLRIGKRICNIKSKAIGTDRMLYYVIFIAGNESQTDKSALKGLSEEIGNAINEHNQHKKTRIAIMVDEAFKEFTDTEIIDEIWRGGYQYDLPPGNGKGFSEIDLCTYVNKDLIKQIHIWDENDNLILGAHGKWINSVTRASAVNECKIILNPGIHLVHYTVRMDAKYGSKVQIEPRGNIDFKTGHTYAIKVNGGKELDNSEFSSWIEDISTTEIKLGCKRRKDYKCP